MRLRIWAAITPPAKAAPTRMAGFGADSVVVASLLTARAGLPRRRDAKSRPRPSSWRSRRGRRGPPEGRPTTAAWSGRCSSSGGKSYHVEAVADGVDDLLLGRFGGVGRLGDQLEGPPPPHLPDRPGEGQGR